jgi:hypothetical protein
MGDWIKWHGGDCPIKSDKTLFDVKMRTNYFNGKTPRPFNVACNLTWKHYLAFDDIIAYRIVEDHEPKDEPVVSRAEIEAEIAKLQAKLDVMPVVVTMYWNEVSATPNRFKTDTHTFEIITINGVPHINGLAMKAIKK